LSKKIVITGGCGFIGSHLVELLSESNEVIAFDRYNSESDHYWLTNSKFKDRFSVVLGDIRDYDSVQSVLKGADVVIHMAALIGIPYSYVSPLAYIRTNVEGTYNVLQASKELELDQVMITSTSETYGTAQYVPMDEDHPKVGQSPYSASKISADQIAISYHRSFDLPVTIVRPFNTYGPRQSARAVIPTIISQIATGKKEIYLGSLNPTRDFNFVFDTCNAFIEIASTENTFGRIINSASNFEISIGDTAKLISKLMNVDINIKEDQSRLRPVDSEVERLYGDNSLLKKLTNWKPIYGELEGFEKGLQITIDWFQKEENLKLYKPETFNIWIPLN